MPSKIKVLYLITGLEVGGAENMLLETLRLLDRKRFLPLVACIRGRGIVGSQIESLGVAVHYLDFSNGFDLSGYRRLRSLLREERPDILNSYMIHANLIGRVMGRAAGVRIVISNVEVKLLEKRYLLFLDKLTSPLVDKYICVSRSVADHTTDVVRIPKRKVEMIWNGINMDKFSGQVDAGKVRSALGLAPGPIVGVICKLRKQKGLTYLLEAARIVKERFPSATFLIAGDGPEEAALRAEAVKLGVSDYCRFLGYRSDTVELLTAIDVYVLPSLFEGLAIGLLEAMYARKAIVCTDIEENAAVIEHEETGLLVPVKDPIRLAEGIVRLLEDSAHAAALAEAAHSLVRDHFSMESNVRQKMELYERLLSP